MQAFPNAIPEFSTAVLDNVSELDSDIGDEFGQPYEVPEEDGSSSVEEGHNVYLTCGNSQGPPLTPAIIEHAAILPAYPQSHSQGYGYIIPVQQHEDGSYPTREEVLVQATQVQYSRRSVYLNRPTTSPFFNSQPASRYKYQCSGVKAYPNLKKCST